MATGWTRRRGVPGAAAALLLACAPAWVGGCRDSRPQPPPAPTTRPARTGADLPDLPGQADDVAASPIMVKAPDPRKRRLREAYVHADDVVAGGVVGVCYIRSERELKLPEPKLLDFTGPYAIRDPQPLDADKVVNKPHWRTGEVRKFTFDDEVSYYKTLKLKAPSPVRWLGPYDRRRKRYAVAGTVIIFRDIPAGRRPPLNRPTQMVRLGQIDFPGDIHRGWRGPNYSGFNIQFGPIGEKIGFTSTDLFQCDLVITHVASGESIHVGRTLPQQVTNVAWSGNFGHGYHGDFLMSPKLERGGLYRIHCRRHPWQVGYLWLVDNPFVDISGPTRRGTFRLDGLPLGRHTADVWHQDFEPVRGSFEVEIRKNEMSEVEIELKMPAAWADLPAVGEDG